VDIDIAQLAAQVGTFLIPYLTKGGEAFAGETGKKIAESLWGKFKPKVDAKESAKEAMQDVMDAPDDKGALASFEHQIKKILAEDLQFATEISIAIENVDISSIQARDKSVIVGRDVNNSNIIIGKGNKVIHADTYIEGNVYKGPAPRNPQEALKIYRDVIARSTSSLPLRGIDLEASDPTSAQKPIGLAHVYIALDTKTVQEEQPEANQKEKQSRILGNIAEHKLLSVLQAVIQNRSVVIKGDPGSGKTTFVSYLAHRLAIQNTGTLEDWNEAETDLLPVIVILRDFAKGLPKKLPAQADPRNIWDFILTRLKAQNLSASSKPILEMLEHGKALIFLDGLDEVPTREQRVFVRDAVQAFANRHSNNRFLVTCRVLSYQPPKSKNEPDLRLANFPEFELAPFDNKKITAFIDGWYGELLNLRTVSVDEAQDSVQRLKTAVQRPELKRLAPNPLLLTVMALVNTHKGRLPDARAVLYDETIDILLWRWEQGSKGQEARLRQLLLEANYQDKDLEQVIWQLAYEAHEQTGAEDENDSLAGISELKLQKVLAEKNNGDLNWAAQIIETMKLRAGLLLERDTGVFTFPHRSFQEYLAATYLDAQDDFVDRAKKLTLNPSIWREVILWAVSRRVYVRGSVSGPLVLVAELCPSRTPSRPNEWSNIWLAGDILLEIGLNRVQNSELGKELWPRVQNSLVKLIEASALTPRERAEAGDTLARLGDPRVGTMTDFLFCEIPAGPFLMGNTKETDSMSDDDEVPQITYNKIKSNYYASRYPITNAQFELFMKDPHGYENNEWWTKTGLDWRKERTASFKQGGAFDLPNHPVVRITWYEAAAFTRWLTNKMRNENAKLKIWEKEDIRDVQIDFTKWEVRLPSEAEWEKAARGTQGLRYPWGNEITLDHANYSDTNIGSTSAVGTFPLGMNGYGLLDMSGNVWEWCATQWIGNYTDYDKNENNDLEGNVQRVVRGGSFNYYDRRVRCAVRDGFNPRNRYYDLGFRVVVSPFFLNSAL